MRIVYFTEWDIFNNSGVLTKIEGQVNTWRRMGHEVYVILTSIPPTHQGLKPLIRAEVNSSSFSRFLPKGFSQTYFNKILSIGSVKQQVEKFSPDIIYTRQAIWYPGLTSLYRKYPTVVELNTDDVSEMKLFSWFKRKAYLFGRERIIQHAAAFLAVSYEIGKIYSVYGKPIEVVANGFDLSKVKRQPMNHNERVQGIFVGSPDQAWHGVDKILMMAKLIPEYDFHIVGPALTLEGLSSNIIQHGYLNKDQLHSLYNKIDIGIGTLALHRNQMTEASPLKVREYAAFGLPIIAGYYDTDLNDQDFLLYIGNYEANVVDSIPAIKSFVEKWRNTKVNKSVVERLVSSEVKESKRLGFFESVLQ